MIRPKCRTRRHQEPPGRNVWTDQSVAVATALLCTIAQVFATEQKYGPGVTDTEIKIGQTMPYSGPASAYSTVGVAQAAYFRMLNENGGIQRPQDQSDFP
jgi:hypothetical protein